MDQHWFNAGPPERQEWNLQTHSYLESIILNYLYFSHWPIHSTMNDLDFVHFRTFFDICDLFKGPSMVFYPLIEIKTKWRWWLADLVMWQAELRPIGRGKMLTLDHFFNLQFFSLTQCTLNMWTACVISDSGANWANSTSRRFYFYFSVSQINCKLFSNQSIVWYILWFVAVKFCNCRQVQFLQIIIMFKINDD